MTRRFYIAPPALDGDAVALEGALAERLSRVLRLRPGDEVTLFDGCGIDARVRIERLSARGGVARMVERSPSPPEPRLRVHLYQSISKGERFAWLVEKGTEIGVARFVPLLAARAIARPAEQGMRIERWRRIAAEAAEQSGRAVVPPVDPPQSFGDALASATGLLIVPYESAGDAAPTIAKIVDQEVADVSLFIGPEGGFEPAEIDHARDAEAAIVTLGRRVLRAETAGLVAATLALQAAGDLG